MTAKVELLQDMDSFRRIAGEWQALHVAAEGSPFSSHEWVLAWDEAYGDIGPGPQIALAWQDGMLVAGALLGSRNAPLSPALRQPKLPTLVPLYQERVGFHEVLARPGHAGAGAEIFDRLLSDGGWKLIDLTPMRSTPALDAFVARARAHGLLVLERAEIRTAVADLGGGWEGYLARRSANGRKTLRGTLREVEAANPVMLRAETPGPDSDAVLERVLDLSARCWKAQMGTDIGSDPRVRKFFRALWRGLSARGAMHLGLLQIGGRDAAATTVLSGPGMDYALVADFDEAFAAYSPGRYMIAQALMDAARRGAHSLDLLRHTGFTERFADRSDELIRLRICRRFGAAGMWLAIEERLRPLGRDLRRRRKSKTRKRVAFK